MADKDNILSFLDEKDFYRLVVQLASEAACFGNDILANIEGSKVAGSMPLPAKKNRLKQVLTNLVVLTISYKDYGADTDMASDFISELYAKTQMPRTGNTGIDAFILGIMKSVGRAAGQAAMKEDKKEPSQSLRRPLSKDDVLSGWKNMGKIKDAPKFEDPDFKNKDMNDFWTQMMQNLQTDKYDDSSYSAYHEPKKTEENYKATWHNEDLKGDQNDESDTDESGN